MDNDIIDHFLRTKELRNLKAHREGGGQFCGSQAVTNAKSMLAVSLAKQLRLLEQQLNTYREWKVVLASWIKSQCGVSNQWLSDHLYMGNLTYASHLVCGENRRPKTCRKH